MDQQGLMNVVKAINDVSESKAAEATISQLIPALWPQLEQRLNEIPNKEPLEKHMRPQTEILEELVSQVRGLSTRMREFDPEIMEREARYRSQKIREVDIRILDDLMHSMTDVRDGDMSLLILAGYVRESIPWLAEILVESHRDLKNASPNEAEEIGRRLMSVIKRTMRGSFGERVWGRSKFSEILMMELPRFLDRAISLKIDSRQIADSRGFEKPADEA
jgi:Rad3-related DNA helicase